MIDKYRVFLLKKKMRSLVEERIEKIRFGHSVDGTYLVFRPSDYVERDAVAEIFSRALTREGIEHEIMRNPYGFYSDLPVEKQPLWYIKIPIDQAALPERKR